MEEFIIPKQSKVKKFFRPLSVKILSVVIVLLIAATSVLSYKLYQNHTRVMAANTTISETQGLLDEASGELAELKKQLGEEKKNNTELQNQLGDSETARQELEEKIASLEDKISKLQSEIKSQKKALELMQLSKYPTISVPIANNGKKVCYLTFDDGPSENTLKIIDVLDTYGIKATFFVTNTGTTKYIKQIHDSGNAIGLHTATHSYSKIYASEKAYFEDLAKISEQVKKYAGIESKIIRFPGGSSNVVSEKYSKGLMKKLTASVEKKGYAYFDWNIDSGDASVGTPSADYIINTLKSAVGSQEKICVLMHDSAAKSGTATALPHIIEWLSSKGYRFEALTTSSPTFHHNIG